jgi:hypothetical protein
VNVRRRKKDVSVSFAYRFAPFTPMATLVAMGFGDASIDMTAGRGIDGAGETDLLEEKEDRRL